MRRRAYTVRLHACVATVPCLVSSYSVAYHSADQRGITLGQQSVTTFTRMVRVFAIAYAIEPIGKTGVETCDSPRLANAHVGECRVARTEPVHTPIKIREAETVALKEKPHTVLSPVLAVPGPFEEDNGASARTMFHHRLE